MRRNSFQQLCACVLLAAFAGAANAELSASITPAISDEMETVRLTLRATDTRRTEKLDLSSLDVDFEILGTQTSSQYRSINGRVESFVEYQINLRPKRSGELTIPPIEIGSDRSRPLKLTVRSLDPGVKSAIDKMVFFETEISPNPVYVQAQTILSRKLFYSNGVQIYSDLPGAPEIPDAVVVPLGDTRSMNVVRDGQRYGVIEQRFAVYPERSGTLTIPAIAVTSSVRIQNGDRIRRSGVRIGTKATTVNVLPVPSIYPADQPWLAASDVRLTDSWTPAIARYDIGDPVTRSIIVTAINNVGSAIPPLKVALPESNFRLYPETPILDDDSSGETIVGARLENFSIIPINPGRISIPPIELTWWDTLNKRVRVSRLAEVIVEINGNVTPAPSAVESTRTSAAPELESQYGVAEPNIETVFTLDDLLTNKLMLWLAGIALFTSLGWMTTVLMISRGFSLRRKRSTTNVSAWPQLKRACRGNDLHEIRSALATFLAEHYGVSNVSAIRKFELESDNRELMQRLNSNLYGGGGGANISGADILQAARALRASTTRGKQKADPLPALYSR